MHSCVMQICGLVLFGLGFVLYIDRESQLYGQLFHLLPSSGPLIALDKIPVVLAGTGTTILLLSFLGCYGACVESVCFLWLVSQSVIPNVALVFIYRQWSKNTFFAPQGRHVTR